MIERDPERRGRRLTGRASRRRFLAGIVAAATAPPLLTAASRSTAARGHGGTIVARQTGGAVTTGTLAVPGAELHYEVAGSGPVLLLIPGGALDADSFGPLARLLAADYTVVRYDPRGISRSRLDGPAEDVPVELHADDAGRLLLEFGDEPSFVLGSSGGAVIGLALATRHPARVGVLVAHEPPVVTLLPEGSERRKANQAIYDTYQAEGIGPALAMFQVLTGLGEQGPSNVPPLEVQEATAGAQQNIEFFFAHYLLPVTAYEPDIAALRGGAPRVVVGVGDASVSGELARDTALLLAERLGSEAVSFPGDHLGYVTQAEAFAETLREVVRTG